MELNNYQVNTITADFLAILTINPEESQHITMAIRILFPLLPIKSVEEELMESTRKPVKLIVEPNMIRI